MCCAQDEDDVLYKSMMMSVSKSLSRIKILF